MIRSAPSSATAVAFELLRHVGAEGDQSVRPDGVPLSEPQKPPAIRVLVVDDPSKERAPLAAALDSASDVAVAATVSSGEEALARLDEAAPDVVLLDHPLPGMSTAATCRAILTGLPAASVVVLAPDVDDVSIRECLSAGARGYVVRNLERDLAQVVRSIARGDRWLDPEVVDRIVEWAQQERPTRSGLPPMSHREKAVLAMLAVGTPNKEIAARLGVSTGTVKATVGSLLRKLRAKNRTEAVSTALRLRIL